MTLNSFDRAWDLMKMPFRVYDTEYGRYDDEGEPIEEDNPPFHSNYLDRVDNVMYSGGSIGDAPMPSFWTNKLDEALAYALFGSRNNIVVNPERFGSDRGHIGPRSELAPPRETVPTIFVAHDPGRDVNLWRDTQTMAAVDLHELADFETPPDVINYAYTPSRDGKNRFAVTPMEKDELRPLIESFIRRYEEGGDEFGPQYQMGSTSAHPTDREANIAHMKAALERLDLGVPGQNLNLPEAQEQTVAEMAHLMDYHMPYSEYDHPQGEDL